jgi:hypothetical protein
MPIPNRQQCLAVLAAAKAVGIPKDLAEALVEEMLRGTSGDSGDSGTLYALALSRIEEFQRLQASCRVLGAPPDAAEHLTRAGMPTIDAARETLLKYAGRDLWITEGRGQALLMHCLAVNATRRRVSPWQSQASGRKGAGLWN